MHEDTIADWQRLTQLYGEMGDVELEELNATIGDLTEVAQQVLRDEIKKRGLDEPRVTRGASEPPRYLAPLHEGPEDDSQTEEDNPEGGDLPHEYTWKTQLCECEDREEAWQIREVLRQAGIESWVEGPGSRFWDGMSIPRILVAADQFERAREIASQPIPQAIVEQSKMQVPDFEPPVCPSCGADDPILEGADPVNSWRCERCGQQWTDTAEDANDSPAQQ
ncbi:MAG: DUF2007 domain-containing protein [Terracidiphilus sp.]|jgi:hypothetical protein